MTMRCVKCGRALQRYSATIPTREGIVGWGPVCVRSVLVLTRKPRAQTARAIKQPAQVDERQLSLELM